MGLGFYILLFYNFRVYRGNYSFALPASAHVKHIIVRRCIPLIPVPFCMLVLVCTCTLYVLIDPDNDYGTVGFRMVVYSNNGEAFE